MNLLPETIVSQVQVAFICSNSPIKTPELTTQKSEQHQTPCSSVFIVIFEHI